MDLTTEPVIAVIGNPIAGNPAQFALERAFESMDLDWRVISFAVPAERLASALDGVEALGFRGVLVDESLIELTSRWYAQRHTGGSSDVQPIDCLFREFADATAMTGAHVQSEWAAAVFQRHFDSRGRIAKQLIRIGRVEPTLWLPEWDQLDDERYRATPEHDLIDEADLILITDRSAVAVDPKWPWPANDASTLVFDLTREGHPDAERIAELGYCLVSSEQRRVGTLLSSIRRWTGSEPSRELLQDAIEEYLAV